MTLDDIEEMPAAEVKQKLEKAEREMSFHEKKTKEVEQMPMAVVEVVMDMSAGNRCISLPPLELKIGSSYYLDILQPRFVPPRDGAGEERGFVDVIIIRGSLRPAVEADDRGQQGAARLHAQRGKSGDRCRGGWHR